MIAFPRIWLAAPVNMLYVRDENLEWLLGTLFLFLRAVQKETILYLYICVASWVPIIYVSVFYRRTLHDIAYLLAQVVDCVNRESHTSNRNQIKRAQIVSDVFGGGSWTSTALPRCWGYAVVWFSIRYLECLKHKSFNSSTEINILLKIE